MEAGRSSFVKTRQIASVVGSQYRLPSGQQLVAVIPRIPPAVEPSTQETPISHIALAQSSAPEDIKVFDTSNSVEYVLCGVGSQGGRCAIGEGKATTERARLLHRESLELALYTFNYVDGVDSVVTLQPPRAGADPTFATFFQKDDFKEELAHPLRQTLEGASPFTTSDFPVAQQARVSQIVTPFLFRFSYQQAPESPADGAAAACRLAFLERSKERLDRLRLLPASGLDRLRARLAVPWLFELPRLRRYDGYALPWNTILLRDRPGRGLRRTT